MDSSTFIQPVILCGGSGTRLWPLSRTGFPKQFLCLTGDDSLFQQAVQRLSALGGSSIQAQPPLIVAGEDHRFLALEQLREMGVQDATFVLEPTARNTAPALTLAALAAVESGTDPVLVVTPADQTIVDAESFKQALQTAIADAAQGHIVILGVTPDKPETGYGYIQVVRHGEARSNAAIHHNSGSIALQANIDDSICGSLPLQANVCQVAAFVEKPNLETAQKYLQEGNYFWNAGMFVLRASVWLKALQNFRPDIAQACQAAWADKKQDGQFIRPDKALFAQVPSESVDYAVMEKCPSSEQSIHMVPLNAGWNDLGAWDAVWNVLAKDAQGNAHTGDVLATDTHNTLVHASSRLVSLVGVSDLVVIETADAVLVASKARSQDVKHIVTALGQQNREEHTLHRKVHRPWGWYDSIDEGGRFKVKRIQVKPKASLSLQKHHHRAEHWIVVTGTAEITNGDKVLTLTENQSTYIPLGEVHRLANPGSIPLEIIEVQSGSYLGEDDIVRYQDNYGRGS
jgi:mannose-1-phosphate guanylyltransferase / mannose-6-phosphate isomerase